MPAALFTPAYCRWANYLGACCDTWEEAREILLVYLEWVDGDGQPDYVTRGEAFNMLAAIEHPDEYGTVRHG